MPSFAELQLPSKGPKYKQIYAKLRQALENQDYPQGSKLPSEIELVEQFGASRPTVNRALAQLSTEGFLERRVGSGTYARAPKQQEGFVFGLLIPDLGTTEIFEPISRGISIARVGGHHDLLWGSTLSPGASVEDQAEQMCQYYLQKRVSGSFFSPLELVGTKDEVNQRITREIDKAQIPIVLLDRDICAYPQRSKYDLVGIDNRRAGFTITNYVLECGARRIVFIAQPGSAPTVAERALGCHEAVGSFADSSAEAWTEFGDPCDISFVSELMLSHRPDAFVCANDYTAAQLMTSLSSLGINVPSEVSVTGMDDIRYANHLQTPLTTIHQPCLELGATALSVMLDRISNPNMPARVSLLDFSLVVRQSTVPMNPSDALNNAQFRHTEAR
jgi:DNA-binding LacI/PurR family transcriptional regulator